MKYETKQEFLILNHEDHTVFKVSEDPGGFECVALEISGEKILFEPEAAILIAEAMTKMAKIMLEKPKK